MINAGDKVEEIATGRRGVIEKILSNGPSGRSIPYEWHVFLWWMGRNRRDLPSATKRN